MSGHAGTGGALLYAPRGLGKTYVALAIGLTVISGRRLFMWEGRKISRTLYIDGEMPARTMQERLLKMCRTRYFGFDRSSRR
ncbi:hypothetical protein C4J81_06320 [Deltaproteobacteria bacterium Smac51]|nr:hypothetical protein C4J81_06320 [Deltaproteobacteria bacterium Smac51]